MEKSYSPMILVRLSLEASKSPSVDGFLDDRRRPYEGGRDGGR